MLKTLNLYLIRNAILIIAIILTSFIVLLNDPIVSQEAVSSGCGSNQNGKLRDEI